ncbi:MAG: creatininase family protein [Acidimicrobiales bacterium]
MMHLRPDLVRPDLMSRNVPEHLAENDHVRFGGSVTFGWLAKDFGPDGHIGDPTGATPEIGEAHLSAAVSRMCDAFREIRDFRFTA